MSWRSSGLIEHLGIRICFSGGIGDGSDAGGFGGHGGDGGGFGSDTGGDVSDDVGGNFDGASARTAMAAMPAWARMATALMSEPLRTAMAPM